jgi:acyl carrier protein
MPDHVWCRAVLRTPDNLDTVITGDLCVFDDRGCVLAEMTGVQLRRISRDLLTRASSTMRAGGAGRGRLRASILRADASERASLIREYVLRQLAAVLQTPLDRLASDQPLLGLVDSLMAVELKQQLEDDLATEVPVALLLSGATADDLADALAAQLSPGPTADLADADPAVLAELVAGLEALPEAEALALLNSRSTHPDAE